jgi:hypothetical protein
MILNYIEILERFKDLENIYNGARFEFHSDGSTINGISVYIKGDSGRLYGHHVPVEKARIDEFTMEKSDLERAASAIVRGCTKQIIKNEAVEHE